MALFHSRLSAESIRLRFFTAHPTLSDTEIRRLTHLSGPDDLALVALRGGDIVAIAQYDRSPESEEAEVAFVVDDAYQGRGLSTLLLERLASEGRRFGIRRFVAHTLWENRAMIGVLHDAGFTHRFSHDEAVVTVVLDIAPSPEALAAADERDRVAVVRSMARLLRPTSVAVIGASRAPGTIGHELVTNLVTGGFEGPVYPVNPSATAVASLPCWPTIEDVPGPVDLAIVAVPAPAVADVVAACGRKGVGGLVLISAGFAEAGAEGALAQRQITRLAHANGMRIVGPNCFGVINTDPAVSMNATFAADQPIPGAIGFASQSGGLGIAILAEARSRGLGLSSFVSMGNKADVSGNDLLTWWEQDDATRVILLYLESFGNPRKFSRIARRVGREKPMVAVKSGRSSAGTRAASSHTAALASSEQAVRRPLPTDRGGPGRHHRGTLRRRRRPGRPTAAQRPSRSGHGERRGTGRAGGRCVRRIRARRSRALVRGPGRPAFPASGLGRSEQPDRPRGVGHGRDLPTLPPGPLGLRRGGRRGRDLHAAARHPGRRRRIGRGRGRGRRRRRRSACAGRDHVPRVAVGRRHLARRVAGPSRVSAIRRRRCGPWRTPWTTASGEHDLPEPFPILDGVDPNEARRLVLTAAERKGSEWITGTDALAILAAYGIDCVPTVSVTEADEAVAAA